MFICMKMDLALKNQQRLIYRETQTTNQPTIRAREDLGAMAVKRYSACPNAPALLEPHHQFFLTLVGGGATS